MNAEPTDTAELQQKLQDKIGQIEAAIVKVRQNILVDVGFMDSEVAALCQSILRLEGEDAKMLEPGMIEMINKLDELAIELKDYQDRIRPEDE